MKHSAIVASVGIIILAGLVVQSSELFGDHHALKYPDGYRKWTHVKSMLIHSKDHPLYDPFGGLHHVYVNDKGLKTLKNGGKYPDGAVFVFDLHNVNNADGAYTTADRKFIGLMVKNSRKYKDTGGWGWDVFKGDAKMGGNVADATKDCYGCHASQEATDFVFSQMTK
jgi:hypothetical protein